jgi:sugar (pentulose or hexulose) kinase
VNGLALGVDLATASARCVALDLATARVVGAAEAPLAPPRRAAGGVSQQEATYAAVALALVRDVTQRLGDRAREVMAVSVTGTSGTVVPCDADGRPVGPARLYDDASQAARLARLGLDRAPTLGRVLALQEAVGASWFGSSADVVGAALTGGVVASDTSHPLKAGIDPLAATWPLEALRQLGIRADRLPELVPPGTVLGRVAPDVADRLGLPHDVVLVAGMTDGCTAQVATGAVHLGDSVGVLGTTLVLKAVCERRVESPDRAVYSHLGPDGSWWAGGASNSGAGVLDAEFPGIDLASADARVAAHPSTVVRYPLSRSGERFPIADRTLPSLTSAEPENADDAYRAVLDGVAFVERLGLERLDALGALGALRTSAFSGSADVSEGSVRSAMGKRSPDRDRG